MGIKDFTNNSFQNKEEPIIFSEIFWGIKCVLVYFAL